MKPTYNPHKKRRAKKHGFRNKMKTHSGKKILNARRKKGRKKLTP
ncbi:MAG: 50S ribosomal protein L34 [bacterium]